MDFYYLFGLLYQTFVIPLFDYCDVIWGPMMNQLKIMECLHSKVVTFVFHIRERLSPACFMYISHNVEYQIFVDVGYNDGTKATNTSV